MTEDRELPAPAKRYMWHAGYNRDDEYDKCPEWTESIESQQSSGDGYGENEVVFYDRFDPEHIWINSDTSYDLMNCR